ANDTAAQSQLEDQITDHVILVGYGRTGQLLSNLLNQQHLPFMAIDQDPNIDATTDTVVHVGDATHSQSLAKFRIAEARALVICIDNKATTLRIIQAARRVAPDLPILVRAHDEAQAQELVKHGATLAIPAVLESGLQLARALLGTLQVPEHSASELVTQLRQQAHPSKDRTVR
ncbi:MAG: NAD(P)-binding protein, partial [Pseudomonadota bacterium]